MECDLPCSLIMHPPVLYTTGHCIQTPMTKLYAMRYLVLFATSHCIQMTKLYSRQLLHKDCSLKSIINACHNCFNYELAIYFTMYTMYKELYTHALLRNKSHQKQPACIHCIY